MDDPPRVRKDPWMSAMRRGDFAAAWKISDRVLRRRLRERGREAALPRHLQQVWDGRPLAGRRVLVRCYHGLGDTIQFARLLPLLRRQAREVVLWAQPPLLPLLHGAPGVDRVEALHDAEPRVDRDADVELMELPHILRLHCAAIPRAPYLRVARRTRRPHAARVHRVGIAWQAGDWNAARSIAPHLLAPLAAIAHVEWASLQYGARAAPLPGHALACADIAEQARRMAALDLVISVDTMVAHLAGAIGVPVWLLLPTPCDWRWMEGRDDSPWYAAMRLFRQARAGDWGEVIDRVRTALAAHVQQGMSPC